MMQTSTTLSPPRPVRPEAALNRLAGLVSAAFFSGQIEVAMSAFSGLGSNAADMLTAKVMACLTARCAEAGDWRPWIEAKNRLLRSRVTARRNHAAPARRRR